MIKTWNQIDRTQGVGRLPGSVAAVRGEVKTDTAEIKLQTARDELVLCGSLKFQAGSERPVSRGHRTAGWATQHVGSKPRQQPEHAVKRDLHAFERKTMPAADGGEQGIFRVFFTRFPRPKRMLICACVLIAVRTRIVRLGAPTRRMSCG